MLIDLSLLGGGTAGRVTWWAAFWGLALNNIFIMGLHSVAGLSHSKHHFWEDGLHSSLRRCDHSLYV